MDIQSVFESLKEIPLVYTCEGRNISPPLYFKSIPTEAKSLVLILEDPDAPDPNLPKMIWDHWVLYNIPPTVTELAEHQQSSDLPKGTLEGLNSWEEMGYSGPCPPIGRHRYYFKLFALDTLLPDLNTPFKKALLESMQGHIIAKAELIGTYQKKK